MRYFLAVAQEKNFTRAAQKLNMAQPPLSRQIQILEEELGVVLLQRNSRPLRLTPAGRVFLEQARHVLARVDGIPSLLNNLQQVDRVGFSIGFVASTIYAALPDLIRRFRAAAPEVNLNLVEIASVKQAAALKSGLIDVGFSRLRFEDEGIRRDVLREERLVVALPLRHWLSAEERPLSFHRLSAEPLIIYPSYPRPSYADQVISLFHDRGLEPNVVQQAKELQIAIGLVAAEVGIAIVPTSVKRLRGDDVVYRDLDDMTITSPIIMNRRIDDHSPQLELMSKVIVEAYQEWGWCSPEGLDR